MRNFAVACVVGTVAPVFAASIDCPPMPGAVTERGRDVKGEIAASVGSFGKLKAGEIGIKAETTAETLFAKFPNADRLLMVQTMASTYCGILRSSDLPDNEKLDRWERFTDRVFDTGNKPAREPVAQRRPHANPEGTDAVRSIPAKILKPPPQPGSNLSRPSSGRPSIECFVTSAGLCSFRVNGKVFVTLETNRRRHLGDVSPGQIWDHATFVTTGSELKIVKKNGKAAVYSPIEDKIVFAYKYEDLVLMYRPDRKWPPTSNIEDFFIVATSLGKKGVVDYRGTTIVPFNFDQVLSTWDYANKIQYFDVMNSGRWGLLDGSGNELLPIAYSSPVKVHKQEGQEFRATVEQGGEAFTVGATGVRK